MQSLNLARELIFKYARNWWFPRLLPIKSAHNSILNSDTTPYFGGKPSLKNSYLKKDRGFEIRRKNTLGSTLIVLSSSEAVAYRYKDLYATASPSGKISFRLGKLICYALGNLMNEWWEQVEMNAAKKAMADLVDWLIENGNLSAEDSRALESSTIVRRERTWADLDPIRDRPG